MASATINLKLTPAEFATYGLALDVLVKVSGVRRDNQTLTYADLGLPANVLEIAAIRSRAVILRKATRES